jgi:predicted DNA-binding transcriptional regulator YafY
MIEQQKILKVFRLIRRLSNGLPAKWDTIAKELDISKSTFYKYVNLLEELGYNVVKDGQGRHKIESFGKNYQHLTQKEKAYVKSLVSSATKKSSIHHSIISKLETSSNIISPNISELLNRVAIIERVIGAIEAKLPISLLKYRSTSIEEDRNRNIFPIFLDEYKLALLAYEYDSCKFKIFKLQRVAGIDNYEPKDVEKVINNEQPTLDSFGFATVNKIKVELLMTRRAAAILTEEFDIGDGCISTTKNSTFPFRYKDVVSDYTGIGRFVLGMCTEVKVVKDDGLKEYLKEKLEKVTIF